ncbi:DUF3108 domain-containing protein [bacterium]|nr:DUF3108 domain-containing protein [bacterium]
MKKNRALVSMMRSRIFLTMTALLVAIALAQTSATAAAATTQLSTLSDGDFERQLELPPHQQLDANSPLFQDAMKTYQRLPFDVGERLRFIVTYLGVSGGQAEVTIQQPVKTGDGWAHRLTGEVKSARWYRWIMQIHDSIEALMTNGSEVAPVRFYINQQEGSFRQTKIINFDSNKGEVNQLTKRKDHEESKASFPFAPGTKDALGALYYLRVKLAASNPPPLQLDVPIFTSEKTWTGKASYLGSDTKKIGKKTYDTDVYRLITTFGGLMEQRGDIKMWFTRDERRIPLYIEASVRFGYIKVTLDEWVPGENRKNQYSVISHDL